MITPDAEAINPLSNSSHKCPYTLLAISTLSEIKYMTCVTIQCACLYIPPFPCFKCEMDYFCSGKRKGDREVGETVLSSPSSVFHYYLCNLVAWNKSDTDDLANFINEQKISLASVLLNWNSLGLFFPWKFLEGRTLHADFWFCIFKSQLD